MATTATISARTREGTGKGAARSSRRQGRIPGILYGHGEESVSLSVDANELQKLVLELKDLPNSYLGPPESYFRAGGMR